MPRRVQTHPLGELSTTLEIVFSTHTSGALTADSVWGVYLSHLHEGKPPAQSTKEISRRNSRERQGQQRRSLSGSRAFVPSCLLTKCCAAGLAAGFRLKHLASPSRAGGGVGGSSVHLCPLSLSGRLFLQTQSDTVQLEHTCTSTLPDPETAGLPETSMSVCWGAEWGVLGDGEDKRGAGMTMPGWDSFSISVFLKKYRLYYHEEEAYAGMVPEFPGGHG